MSPEKNLRLPLRWEFSSDVGPLSGIVWRWRAYDSAGRLTVESPQPFETLSDCIDDAKQHGYIEPERR
jgi:hypothetical protein